MEAQRRAVLTAAARGDTDEAHTLGGQLFRACARAGMQVCCPAFMLLSCTRVVQLQEAMRHRVQDAALDRCDMHLSDLQVEAVQSLITLADTQLAAHHASGALRYALSCALHAASGHQVRHSGAGLATGSVCCGLHSALFGQASLQMLECFAVCGVI